jgi:hypothetical protein
MKRAPVDSTSLATVGYEDGTLEVEFKHGGVYQYYLVTPALCLAFLEARSMGAFLNERIKPHHAFRKVK